MSMEEPRRVIARLAVAIMAADGRITTSEMDTVSHLDGLGLGDLAGPVREEIEAATRHPIDPTEACAQLPSLPREAAATIVAALAEIALADKVLSRRESHVLVLIARALGLADEETEEIVRASLAAHGGRVSGEADSPPSPHAPAEVEPSPPSAAAPEGVTDETSRLAWAQHMLGIGADAAREQVDEAYLPTRFVLRSGQSARARPRVRGSRGASAEPGHQCLPDRRRGSGAVRRRGLSGSSTTISPCQTDARSGLRSARILPAAGNRQRCLEFAVSPRLLEIARVAAQPKT